VQEHVGSEIWERQKKRDVQITYVSVVHNNIEHFNCMDKKKQKTEAFSFCSTQNKKNLKVTQVCNNIRVKILIKVQKHPF